MKTIAYVLAAFPVLSETFVGTEIRAMERLGHKVLPIVLSRSEGTGQPADAPLAERAIYLDQISPLKALMNGPFFLSGLAKAKTFVDAQQGIPSRSLLFNAAKIAAAARAAGCEHIHAHFAWAASTHAIAAARLLGLPVSFTTHGSDFYTTPTDLPAKLEHADLVVTVCEDMRRDVLAKAPNTKTTAIYTGIEADRFKPDWGQPSNGRLLFIARLIDCKGTDDVIEALSRMAPEHRPHIDIVGRGPLGAALKKLAEDLDVADKLHFLGPKPADWIIEEGPKYQAYIGAFRPGSDGSQDTGPVVVKEAMAMGLPIIGTRFMGLKEMVCEACGELVPVRDADALATAIDRIGHLSAEQRSAMGRAGRDWVVSNFTSEHQAKAMSEAIQALGEN